MLLMPFRTRAAAARAGKFAARVVSAAIVLVPLLARADKPVAREVEFAGAGGTPLAGTLLLPSEAAQRYPALVLLAGSGPTNRDGNQPPLLVTDLLKQIAQSLAAHGVASLRFDKRGMHANAAHLPTDHDEFGEFFAWEQFVGDARRAYEFLSEQTEIDPQAVGILGHSEGAVLALVVADQLACDAPQSAGDARRPPSALVLVAAPGRPLDALLDEQLRALLARQAATGEQTEFYMAENARITAAIRETGVVPDDVPPGLRALYPGYLGRFLQSCYATDPEKLAERYTGPVLVIAGEQDIQVSVERDAAVLDAALARRTADDHRLVVVPGASHNLKPVTPENAHGLGGEVPPDVLETLSCWVAARLRGDGGN